MLGVLGLVPSGSLSLSGPPQPQDTLRSSLGTSKGRESSGGTAGRRGVPYRVSPLLTHLAVPSRQEKSRYRAHLRPRPSTTLPSSQASSRPRSHSPTRGDPEATVARKPTGGDGVRPLNLGAFSGLDEVWRSVREGLRSGRAEGRWRRSPARAQSLRFRTRCGSVASEEGCRCVARCS